MAPDWNWYEWNQDYQSYAYWPPPPVQWPGPVCPPISQHGGSASGRDALSRRNTESESSLNDEGASLDMVEREKYEVSSE